MKKDVKLHFDIFIRYLILILIGILGVRFFYFLFTALTIYPLHFLFNLFFNVSRSADILFVQNIPIKIIGSCVAGSAYYLLLILNLATPKIDFKKRILSLLFSFGSLLVVNILRIFFLSFLLISGSALFDIAHKFLWVIGSVIFVVGIWFITLKLFKIEEIPFYSDLSYLLKYSIVKKSKRRKKN